MAQKSDGREGEATRAGGREDSEGGREAIAISDSMSSDGGGGCGSRMKEERRCCGIEREGETIHFLQTRWKSRFRTAITA